MADVPKLQLDGPQRAPHTIALAHGAGAGMDTPFLEAMARELAARGHRVVRFEFPYMARRRETGQKSAPDRPAVLEETWRAVIEHLGADNLVIGGKSMGGRIASMVADASEVAALVCLGYPFHPVGKPDQLRVDHLRALRTAALFCQGTRDPFGTQAEVSQYELSPSIEFCWLDDGDHSFKPRKKSGRSAEQNFEEAVTAITNFLASTSEQ